MPLLVVGTFNTPELFTVRFTPQENHKLELVSTSQVVGKHSWLSSAVIQPGASRSLVGSTDAPTHLYATCWTEPPGVAAYRIVTDGSSADAGVTFDLLNTAETSARSGYVTIGQPARLAHPVLYTVGGPTGEVIGIDAETGAFDLDGSKHPATTSGGGGRIQEFDCVTGLCSSPGKTLAETREQDAEAQRRTNGNSHGGDPKLDGSGGKNNMDFGGLRHGGHGIDLSIDGTAAFVPDIGRNCIWVYDVQPEDGSLRLSQKCAAGRPNDGPRHTIAHPGGKYLYCLQEHSLYVDVYEILVSNPIGAGEKSGRTTLEWRQGVRIIPRSEDERLYWADEVRVSAPEGPKGRRPYLYASTRGLSSDTKGWVAVFDLESDGSIASPAVPDVDLREQGWSAAMWQTPASGGWANAIEPCPTMLADKQGQRQHYAALTDSEVGVLRILKLQQDGEGGSSERLAIEEVATLELGLSSDGQLRQAATAVWLS